VSVEVRSNMTADLADLGWLAEPDHPDKGAIAPSLTGLVEPAIEVGVTPAPSSQGKVSFMLEIQHSRIRDASPPWLAASRSAAQPSCNRDRPPSFRRPIARNCTWIANRFHRKAALAGGSWASWGPRRRGIDGLL
jgi:hypothetical protein